jgi:hypothetical protein
MGHYCIFFHLVFEKFIKFNKTLYKFILHFGILQCFSFATTSRKTRLVRSTDVRLVVLCD